MSATLDPRRREAARLAELNRLGAMQPEADLVLQELVDDAREVFGAQYCMVNLVTADTQFFKAWSGEMPPEVAAVRRAPRERTMCRHVVEDEQQFIVRDFFTTERFREQHLRMGPGIRFYAGTPLKTSGGHAIGSLSLLDGRPREFDDKDEATLRAFARAVVGRLETLGAAAQEREAKESERQYRQNVFELANDAILIYGAETGLVLDANRRACEMYGLPQETLVGEKIAGLSLEPGGEEGHVREVLQSSAHRGFETVHRRADGTPMDVSINSSVTEYGGQQAILSIVRDVTGRKRTEEALRRSEESLAQAQRIAHVGNWEYELGSHRAHWSDEMYRIFGFAPLAILPSYKAFIFFVHPEDKERLRGSIRCALYGDGPEDIEYHIVRPDGEVRHVHTQYEVAHDGDGRPAKFVGTVQDITDRKRVERKLEAAEERYRLLVEQIPAVAYIDRADVADVAFYTSPRIEALLGYTPEEWLDGRLWLERLHPEDRDRVLEADTRVREAEEPFGEEYRLVARDGREVWVRDESVLLRGEEGLPHLRQGVLLDITERKRAEEALRESEERYRLVARATNEVIWDNDLATGRQEWDGAVRTMFGYSLQERGEDGRWWEDRLHPDDRRRVLSSLEAILGGGAEVWTQEYRFRRRDGTYATVVDRGYVVRDGASRPVRMLGSMMDITERKRTEEELEESRRRLSALLSNAPTMVYRGANEPGWPFEFVSDYALELTGYTPEELTDGRAFFGDLIVEEDRQRVWDKVQAGLSERGSFELRYSLRSRDGEERHVEERGRGVRVEGGVVETVEGVVYDVTERVRAEERLGEAERRYRTLVEQIPAVTYVQEASGPEAMTYVSPQMETMLGYAPEECVSDPDHWIKILHPDDRERVLAANDLSNATGEPFDEEYRMIAKDGRVVWMHDASVVLRGAEGRPSYRQGVMYDVTERRQTEEALHASERRLRTVIEQSPLGIHIFAPDGASLLTNGAWDELWYLDAEEAAQEGNVFEDEQLRDAGLIRYIERSAEEGAAVIAPLLLFDPANAGREGRPRWLRTLIYPVKGEDGRVLETVLLLEDFTERKRAEDALKESEERYRAVVEQSAEAIWMFDPETKRVLETNAAFQEMLGYDAEELRAMTNYDFVAHSREDVDRTVGDKIQEEGDSRSERKYRMKNGTLLDVEVGGTVISYRGKEVVCSVARDITERKRVEEEIRETNRRLGELATLRADFTAMVAHELDTPLAVIRGYADMLATGELGPTGSERALAQIQSETEVLNALVEDVRVAAFAERRDFMVNPREVPVDELLDAAARFVVTLPGDHPLSLEYSTEGGRWDGVWAGFADPFIFEGANGPEVWADRYRIGQVLRNLLANAVKYSPEGSPIGLRAVPGEAPGRLRIEVTDRGPGIHPDDMERVFEKFGRGRTPEGQKVSGLGLGLYLSRRILQAHGSDLTVGARPDGGSVFGFELGEVDR